MHDPNEDPVPHRPQQGAPQRLRGLRRRFAWLRRRPSRRVLVRLLAVCGFAAILAGVIGVLLLRPYHRRAQEFDLAEIAAVELSSTVFSRHDEPIGSIMTENRRPVAYKDLPEHLVNALIATEDARFHDHAGFDPMGMLRAFFANLRSDGIAQGASTITQQLARQTFDLREVSYERKLIEIFLAVRVERAYSKADILQHYLNLIYFGNGFFGIEAAAQGYFGKPCSALSLTEAATLVGLIKRPNAYNPFADADLARATRDLTLRRMREEGYLSSQALETALQQPVAALPREARAGRQHHIMAEIRRRLDAILGESSVSREGLSIHTTLDPVLEEALRRAIRARLAEAEAGPGTAAAAVDDPAATANGPPDDDRAVLEAAGVVIDHRTGELLASVGGRDFERSEFDRAFQARRPLGTAFTPFVYAAALEAGVHPFEPVLDGPLDNREVMIGALEGIVGEWGAENPDNRYLGELSAWEAIVYSKNAATVRLGRKVELERILAFARKAGFESPLNPAPSTLLGQSEVTPAEATLAFTTFANGGVRPREIVIIRRVVDADGGVLYEAPAPPVLVPVLAAHLAGHVQTALVEVLRTGTAHAAAESLGFAAMPAAGKTGTAYGFTDAWFIGYNSRLTCGVWVGHDQPREIGPAAWGSAVALPIWADFMNASVEFLPPSVFEPPPGCEPVMLCDRSGMRATAFCAVEPVFPVPAGTSAPEPGTGAEPASTPDIEAKPPAELRVASIHEAQLLPAAARALTDCELHTEDPSSDGSPRPKESLHVPRASLAIADPVYPLQPTLEGRDPFGSLAFDEIPAARAVNDAPRRQEPLAPADDRNVVPSATPVARNRPARSPAVPFDAYPPGTRPPENPPRRTSADFLPPGAYPPGAQPPDTSSPGNPPRRTSLDYLPPGAFPPGTAGAEPSADSESDSRPARSANGVPPSAGRPSPPRALPYRPPQAVPLGPATAPPPRGLRPVQPWTPPAPTPQR